MISDINLNKWMKNFINKITVNTNYLNGLDTAIGDGDHGDNMRNGVLKLQSYIKMQRESSDKETENAKDLFNIMSVLFLSNIDGASGPLYAAAFKNMADSWDNEEVSLSEILFSGINGIKRIGHCKVGDKTMLDVWHGVYNQLDNGTLTVNKIQEEVQNTKSMLAKKGRASYFGDRSIGHIDPGAQSSGYFFEAMVESVENK